MYIQVTDRCNMKCAHCCFSCTENGNDMSMEMFKKVIHFSDEYITIGGGEPTLNKNILAILGLSALYADDVTMICNGTCELNTWTVLVDAYKRNKINLRVSYDPWHNKKLVKPYVRNTLLKDNLAKSFWWGDPKDHSSRTITYAGRAKKNLVKLIKDSFKFGYTSVRVEKDTGCGSVLINPKGYVYGIDKCFGKISYAAIDEANDYISRIEDGSWSISIDRENMQERIKTLYEEINDMERQNASRI